MTRKLYPYVGPAHLAKQAAGDTPRLRVENPSKLIAWADANSTIEPDGTLTLTFVVLPDGLWVADRHSEHVACARGVSVHSAGEITFALKRDRGSIEAVYVTNQSTGYCPEPESWSVVQAALDVAGIAHSSAFSAEMIFRRCPKCASTNIVKDGWYICSMCGRACHASGISESHRGPESGAGLLHLKSFPIAGGKYQISKQIEAPKVTPTPLLEAA